MPTLLRIDASSRLNDSYSRQLADDFVDNWLDTNSKGEVITRDLVTQPLPHISEATIGGFYTPVEALTPELKQATDLSDKLINEMFSADILLIDIPMYNFSVPSALKAWIDQIVRTGKTFNYSAESGFEGLVKDKQAVIITPTGASFSDDSMKSFDFLTPYLNTLLSFLGFTDISFLSIECTTTDETAFEKSIKAARQKIKQFREII